jgi:hypothetical protein
MSGPNMDDYIDVAERIIEFRTKHPEGSLQQRDIQFIDFAGVSWVVFTAQAYRSPDDPRPGEGTAWEPVPGRTPFTRGSEVQNAETAAWGRAIVAALAADTKRGIASKQEVRAREEERRAERVREPQEDQWTAQPGAERPALPMADSTRARMFALFGEHAITDADEQKRGIAAVIGREVESRGSLTEGEAQQVIAVLAARPKPTKETQA